MKLNYSSDLILNYSLNFFLNRFDHLIEDTLMKGNLYSPPPKSYRPRPTHQSCYLSKPDPPQPDSPLCVTATAAAAAPVPVPVPASAHIRTNLNLNFFSCWSDTQKQLFYNTSTDTFFLKLQPSTPVSSSAVLSNPIFFNDPNNKDFSQQIQEVKQKFCNLINLTNHLNNPTKLNFIHLFNKLACSLFDTLIEAKLRLPNDNQSTNSTFLDTHTCSLFNDFITSNHLNQRITIKSILDFFNQSYLFFDTLRKNVQSICLDHVTNESLTYELTKQFHSFFDRFLKTTLSSCPNQSTQMNFILALNEQHSCFLNDYFSKASVDNTFNRLQEYIPLIFQKNDSTRLIRPAINVGSIVTFTDARKWRITHQYMLHNQLYLELLSCSISNSIHSPPEQYRTHIPLSQLLNTATSLEIGQGGKLISEGIFSFKEEPSNIYGYTEFDEQWVSRTKNDLFQLGCYKKRTITRSSDDVTITSNNAKQKLLGMGISKKVLRGVSCKNSKQEYAVSKIKIDTWLKLCQSIKEAFLTNRTIYSYTGKKRNAISIEPLLYNSDSRAFSKQQADNPQLFFNECWSELKSLHQKGIIHNDFKLSNTVLNNDLHVELIDFSFSFSIDNQSFDSAVIHSYQLGGTFCPQTLFMTNGNEDSFNRNEATKISIKSLNDLTLKFKKSIDLWAFVMQLFEFIDIIPYYYDKLTDKFFYFTANTLHKKLQAILPSQRSKLNTIHSELYTKVLAFLDLTYDNEGYVTKTNGESLNKNGKYDIPNNDWDWDSEYFDGG